MRNTKSERALAHLRQARALLLQIGAKKSAERVPGAKGGGVVIYCAACGSRHVHVEEWRDANTGAFICEASDDFHCADCDCEVSITYDRSEAATARLESRLQREVGCTCGAELSADVPPECVAFPKVHHWTFVLKNHEPHCEAARRSRPWNREAPCPATS